MRQRYVMILEEFIEWGIVYKNDSTDTSSYLQLVVMRSGHIRIWNTLLDRILAFDPSHREWRL